MSIGHRITRYTEETVIGTDGNTKMKPYFFDGREIREKLMHMIYNGFASIEINGKKCEVYSDFRHPDGSRETVIKVEGL